MSDLDTKIIDAHPRGVLGWLAIVLFWVSGIVFFFSFIGDGNFTLTTILFAMGLILFIADNPRRLFDDYK